MASLNLVHVISLREDDFKNHELSFHVSPRLRAQRCQVKILDLALGGGASGRKLRIGARPPRAGREGLAAPCCIGHVRFKAKRKWISVRLRRSWGRAGGRAPAWTLRETLLRTHKGRPERRSRRSDPFPADLAPLKPDTQSSHRLL